MKKYLLLIAALLVTTPTSADECGTIQQCAQQAVEAAFQAKTALQIAVPKGAIMAFALDNCPKGWANFEAANGRFLRGIDVNNAGIDPDGIRNVGSIQADSLQSHEHGIRAVQSSAHAPGNRGGHGYAPGPMGSNVGSTHGISSGQTRQNASETRVKNVAVLFCVRN